METACHHSKYHNFLNVCSWHSADISALPHPGIFELSFDIPYQMLLIPF
nr:MAG TPA: hypothetical protein [Caudoviricetes sp.]